MKMTQAAFAAALAACTGASAQTSVTLYGIADGGVSYVSGIDAAKTRLVSGIMEGSRWGLRGNEDLGGGYRALFTLENRFELDTGALGNRPLSGDQVPANLSSASALGLPNALQPVVSAVAGQIGAQIGVNHLTQNLFDRQAYVGLVTPVGALLAGRQYTPGYELSATFEVMRTESSLAFGQVAAFPPSLEIRTPNALAYRIQTEQLIASLMVAAGEGSASTGRFVSAMAMYKMPVVSFGAAYQTRENERGQKALTNIIVGASGAIGPGSLYLQYVNIKDEHPGGLTTVRNGLLGAGFDADLIVNPVVDAYSEALKQDANAYHVGYRIVGGPHTVSVAYNVLDDRRDLNADTHSYGAVYTYSFSKRTDLNFVLVRFDNNDTAQTAPGQAGFIGGFTSEPGRDATNVALGLRHRF